MIVSKEFVFAAAHKLDWHKGKCKKLHGHTYKLRVSISGQPDKNGIIMDFADIKSVVTKEIIDILDHHFLNEIMTNPTAENLVIWIWDHLFQKFQGLDEIKLWESESSFVAYKG